MRLEGTERRPRSPAPAWAAGLNLIDYLCRRFSYADRAAWGAQLALGALRLDGRTADGQEILRGGELIEFTPPQGIEEEWTDPLECVYEDELFLIFDKPPGLVCQPSGRYFKRSLWYLVSARHPGIGIATRLDRETSGLVLCCKGGAGMRLAQDAMVSGRLRKTYLVLVRGDFPDEALAEGWIGPLSGSRVRKMMGFTMAPAGPDSKPCRTFFKRLAGDGRCSLLRARTDTGRTHQIRASLLALGYPIIGDKLYGGDPEIFVRMVEGRMTMQDRDFLILPFQALHCETLEFPDAAGSPARVSSSPPPSWSVAAAFDLSEAIFYG